MESLGGGVACLDYDLDGTSDLAFAGGGKIGKAQPVALITGLPCSLFRNVLFRPSTDSAVRYCDVTQVSGLDFPVDYSHGLFVADFDGDGFSDVLLTAYGTSRLFGNCGDGTFQERREQGSE